MKFPRPIHFPPSFPARMERRMEILGRLAHARWRTVAVDQNARRHKDFPLPRHQSQRRAHRLPRRQLGHGRLAQARLPRTPRAFFPSAPRRQPEHHSQLGRPEHRANLLRSRRRIRTDGLERFLGIHAELQRRSRRSRAVSRQRPRHHPALPQSSLDRRVVRPQRRRAPAHPQRRPHRTHPLARTEPATTSPVRTRSIFKTAVPTNTWTRRSITPR